MTLRQRNERRVGPAGPRQHRRSNEPDPPGRKRLRVEFKWFDLWVGAFWDRKSRTLYVCPLPCVVVIWGVPA